MKRLFGVLGALLVASLLLWAADTGAQQQPAPRPGAPAPAPATPAPSAGEAKSVEGKVKQWDAATSMLTLDDGTQISVPAGAKGRAQLKEGATVKASYEEKAGQKVARSVEVTP